MPPQLSSRLTAALILPALAALGCDSAATCELVTEQTAIGSRSRFMGSCELDPARKVEFLMLCGSDDAAQRRYAVELRRGARGAPLAQLRAEPHQPRVLDGVRLVERNGADFVPGKLEGKLRVNFRTLGTCLDEQGADLPACTLELRSIVQCESPSSCKCPAPEEGAAEAPAGEDAASSPASAAPPAPAPPPAADAGAADASQS